MTTSASVSIASNLAALADPPVRVVDGPAVDYLFIEQEPFLRVSQHIDTQETVTAAYLVPEHCLGSVAVNIDPHVG